MTRALIARIDHWLAITQEYDLVSSSDIRLLREARDEIALLKQDLEGSQEIARNVEALARDKVEMQQRVGQVEARLRQCQDDLEVANEEAKAAMTASGIANAQEQFEEQLRQCQQDHDELVADKAMLYEKAQREYARAEAAEQQVNELAEKLNNEQAEWLRVRKVADGVCNQEPNCNVPHEVAIENTLRWQALRIAQLEAAERQIAEMAKLADEWRTRAARDPQFGNEIWQRIALRRCADELSALLSPPAAPPPTEQPKDTTAAQAYERYREQNKLPLVKP